MCAMCAITRSSAKARHLHYFPELPPLTFSIGLIWQADLSKDPDQA